MLRNNIIDVCKLRLGRDVHDCTIEQVMILLGGQINVSSMIVRNPDMQNTVTNQCNN